MAEDDDDDGAEETSNRTAISDPQSAVVTSGTAWVLIAAVVLLIGIAAFAGVFLFLSSDTAEPVELHAGKGGSGESTQAATTAAAGDAAPSPLPDTTTSVMENEQMTSAGTTAATDTTTTTEQQTTTTTMRPLSSTSMLCVFGATLDPRMTFPEDGICDVSFFQTLEKEGPFLAGKSGGPSLDAFTAAAAKHSKTEYGISLDFKHHDASVDVVSTSVAKKTVEDLWRKKIYHWGYLNNEHYRFRSSQLLMQFRILRGLKGMLDSLAKPPRPYYLVYRDTFSRPFRKKKNLKNMREILWLDGFVVLTHLVDDDRDWTAGRILPPTFWINWNIDETAYAYSLTTGHQALEELAKEQLNGTAVFLSVTMAARRYHPNGESACYSEELSSNETFFFSTVDYCKNSKYKLGFTEADPVGPFYVSTDEDRFIAFDDSRSIAMKFCQGKTNHTTLKYGIAVFDVEMDDSENKCGKGAYARLKAVRKLVDYMNNNFTSPSGLADCAKGTRRQR